MVVRRYAPKICSKRLAAPLRSCKKLLHGEMEQSKNAYSAPLSLLSPSLRRCKFSCSPDVIVDQSGRQSQRQRGTLQHQQQSLVFTPHMFDDPLKEQFYGSHHITACAWQSIASVRLGRQPCPGGRHRCSSVALRAPDVRGKRVEDIQHSRRKMLTPATLSILPISFVSICWAEIVDTFIIFFARAPRHKLQG